jgi:hypothetical protein
MARARFPYNKGVTQTSLADMRAARALPFLPPLAPIGWVEAPITGDMLDEVDNKESDNFTDFDDEKDAPGITDEQSA